MASFFYYGLGSSQGEKLVSTNDRPSNMQQQQQQQQQPGAFFFRYRGPSVEELFETNHENLSKTNDLQRAKKTKVLLLHQGEQPIFGPLINNIQGTGRVDIHTHPYTTAACAAGVVTKTTDDRDSLR